MNIVAENRNWLNEVLEASSLPDERGQPDWLKAYRHQARGELAAVPMPHRKQELWRYTSTDKLFEQDFKPAVKQRVELDHDLIRELFTEGLDAYRLVFVNGHCSPPYCVMNGLPSGVHVGSLNAVSKMDEELVSPWLGKVEHQQGRLFGLLNNAMMQDGLFLHVDAGVKLDKPIEVLYLGRGSEASILTQPRGLVVLEQGAEATLIEHFVGEAGALYFNNNQTEIVTQENASLTHYRVQDESAAAFHVASLHVLQDASSHYVSRVFSLGASWARTEINVRYAGEHAKTDLKGLYLVDNQQMNDIHLDIVHNLPACHSEETFKGLLYGKGRAVFDGRIEVAKHAQKTGAHLSNDNLMLTRGAEVDTKPQLEIYADDVQCSHGTTVGQIEDDQLFYLRSRGIDEHRARTMLSLGFVGEIVDSVGDEFLKARLMHSIEARLNTSSTDDMSQAVAGNTAIDNQDKVKRIIDAMKTVKDPEIPVNIYDLGLVYEIRLINGNKVDVKMTLTSPACPVAQSLPAQVEDAILAVDGIDDAKVTVVWDPPWTKEKMTEEARLALNLI